MTAPARPTWLPHARWYVIPRGAVASAEIERGEIEATHKLDGSPMSSSVWPLLSRAFAAYPDKHRDHRVWLVERDTGTGHAYSLVNEQARDVTDDVQKFTQRWTLEQALKCGFGGGELWERPAGLRAVSPDGTERWDVWREK